MGANCVVHGHVEVPDFNLVPDVSTPKYDDRKDFLPHPRIQEPLNDKIFEINPNTQLDSSNINEGTPNNFPSQLDVNSTMFDPQNIDLDKKDSNPTNPKADVHDTKAHVSDLGFRRDCLPEENAAEGLPTTGDLPFDHGEHPAERFPTNSDPSLDHDGHPVEGLPTTGNVPLDHGGNAVEGLPTTGNVPLDHDGNAAEGLPTTGDVLLDHDGHPVEDLPTTADLPLNHGGHVEKPKTDENNSFNPQPEEAVKPPESSADTPTLVIKPSINWKDLFEQEMVGKEFFDAVVNTFEKLVKTVQIDETSFITEIESAIQWTLNDVACTKDRVRSFQRIDSYLYIYRRLDEFLIKLNRSLETLPILEQCILEVIGSVFKESDGKDPNLIIRNKEVLIMIDIPRHLSSIIDIADQTTLLQFLALIKLSIQVKKITKDQPSIIDWKVLLNNIRSISYPAMDFIDTYIQYSNEFRTSPIDSTTFMHLVSRGYDEDSIQGLPLDRLLDQYEKIRGGKATKFYDEFQPIFEAILMRIPLDIEHIYDLLSRMQNDERFVKYFRLLSSSPRTRPNDFLELSLTLARANIFTTFPERCFSQILSTRIMPIDFEMFLWYAQSVNECVKIMKVDSTKLFIQFFEKVFVAFFEQNSPQMFHHRLNRADCISLLQISTTLFSRETIKKPSFTKLVHQIIFSNNNHLTEKSKRIEKLLNNVKDFAERFDKYYKMENIIHDTALHPFVIDNVDTWCTIDEQTYQKLSEVSQENTWVIHVWSKIVQASVSKFSGYYIDNLLKLDQWMKSIHHERYEANDHLTIILVKTIFSTIINKHSQSLYLLPPLDAIMNFILGITHSTTNQGVDHQIRRFVDNCSKTLKEILQFDSSHSTYIQLSQGSILTPLLPDIQLTTILNGTDHTKYRFPSTSRMIDDIIGLPKPNDINITDLESNIVFYRNFIDETNRWLQWFNYFLETFYPIVNWLKICNVEDSYQLSSTLSSILIDHSSKIPDLKQAVERVVSILEPLKDLQRLCYLFNGFPMLQVLDSGTLIENRNLPKNAVLNHSDGDLKVERGIIYEHKISVGENHQVEWFLTCNANTCSITIEFHIDGTNNNSHLLFKNERLALREKLLHGVFDTQKNGALIIRIDNSNEKNQKTLLYRIRTSPLTTSRLFDGIFSMMMKNIAKDSIIIDKMRFSRLVDETFDFIGKLTNGDLLLSQMSDLREIFSGKNINIEQEVKKILAKPTILDRDRYVSTASTKMKNIIETIDQKKVEQVCEWLQIYQLLSYIEVVVKCLKVFGILDETDDTLRELMRVSENENSSLKLIAQTYNILKTKFQRLNEQHLQLIKLVVERNDVVALMKSKDLYSDDGKRRFQELKDNLTTQFQLQEKNTIVLNSLIMTYDLLKPFVSKANNFDDFVKSLAELAAIDANRLSHIEIIHNNIQLVSLWLSMDTTAVLDNALITMDYLYRNGKVFFFQNRIVKKLSYYEVHYSVERLPSLLENSATNMKADPNNHGARDIPFTLAMSDVDDHKRQLTFCSVDENVEMKTRKPLVDGQLEIFDVVGKIFSIFNDLEAVGHPDYQLIKYDLDINLKSDAKNHLGKKTGVHQRLLSNAVRLRINNLLQYLTSLKDEYESWLSNLREYRDRYPILTLYSNHEIMTLIILLRPSDDSSQIRKQFLKRIYNFSGTNQQNEEENYALDTLIHYLRSLRRSQNHFDTKRLKELYKTFQIEKDKDTSLYLEKLGSFIREVFQNDKLISAISGLTDKSQQFIVRMKSSTSKRKAADSFDLNMNCETYCVILNLFPDQLPMSYQILWCSKATATDIELFFLRIRAFPSLVFLLLDIDQMHPSLREVLFKEQCALTKETSYGTVYYFSDEISTGRKGLRDFLIQPSHRNLQATYRHVQKLFSNQRIPASQLQVIYGLPGVGKTHKINNQYKTDHSHCFSINDEFDIFTLISSFLSFGTSNENYRLSVIFNISIHAPFELLNHTLFSLFICGSLSDTSNGLVFTLPQVEPPWKFIIEVPYSPALKTELKNNVSHILPVISIVSALEMEEITDDNYQLHIGDEERTVAKFLKAYQDRNIDRFYTRDPNGTERPVDFDDIVNENDCRDIIQKCMRDNLDKKTQNKIFKLSFVKFMYRRVLFFQGFFYRYNATMKSLGSTAMKQMIEEVNNLMHVNFSKDGYSRVYLVYDSCFSLRLLHNDWNQVKPDLKAIFSNKDPTSAYSTSTQYYAECLAWLIGIKHKQFESQMNRMRFILTENFAYKLFHIHERKLTGLALIIEGETGVGKTFLLHFYSLLLNPKEEEDASSGKMNRQILENSSQFLYNVIRTHIENDKECLDLFSQRIEAEIANEGTYSEEHFSRISYRPNTMNQGQNLARASEEEIKKIMDNIKAKLSKSEYKQNHLYQIWVTIMIVISGKANSTVTTLIEMMHNFISNELINYRLIEGSQSLIALLEETNSPSAFVSVEMFRKYLFESKEKQLFYRKLIHPGITEEKLIDFMNPIVQLARELPEIELVVFFDELNTSSCLGLFKEMFMDRTLRGNSVPKNIFFTAAINPKTDTDAEPTLKIHRTDYIVHKLPQSLEELKVKYGSFETKSLETYIAQKIKLFQTSKTDKTGRIFPLDDCFQDRLSRMILIAHTFCEEKLGASSVSQREIQRCFNLIEFFWDLRYPNRSDHDIEADSTRSLNCIALSIALIYYFRLPTRVDNEQRNDKETPSREDLAELLDACITEFADGSEYFSHIIENQLNQFVNKDNFEIPPGVAINQAVREHIFAIVVSFVSRTPLCIIGVPGQSKTLSFQIVLQNLRGSQLSPKSFCKSLPEIDPFFCLGSKYTTSDDVAAVFDRAIKREQQYEQNQMKMRCVVFLDEASLPDEKKMVLKVLHRYLDECEVAFVAVANQSFDAANANRMICVYRSLPSEADQKILANGCLGLQIDQQQDMQDSPQDRIVSGLCQGYRHILIEPKLPHIFHDRDFIYMLRELRFALTQTTETAVADITPLALLRALEHNFNGIHVKEFKLLVKTFATAIVEKCPDLNIFNEKMLDQQRDIIAVFCDSMKLNPDQRRLYGRYKLIIDESEDESAIRLLSQMGILGIGSNRMSVFRMSDFSDDTNNDLKNVEVLSKIKLCMETGKTIVMINTGRIHGSLYDVFNQNFSIMSTNENRKIFSKVAIGPKTADVLVHEDFQCIVHVKRSEFKDIPAPFLSRFQKYSLSVNDFYRIQLQKLPWKDRAMLGIIEGKARSFVQHCGEENLHGFNDNTIKSFLLSCITQTDADTCVLMDIQDIYTQLTISSREFIEQVPTDQQFCLLYTLLSKLMQLASPESIIHLLPSFEKKFSLSLCRNYFYQQEHFHLHSFLMRLIKTPETSKEDNVIKRIRTIKKLILFTRTSTFTVNLYKGREQELFGSNFQDDTEKPLADVISLLNLSTIQNSRSLQEEFDTFENDSKKSILITVVDARSHKHTVHIPFVRQMIDDVQMKLAASPKLQEKYFVILIHSVQQEVQCRSCFPSTFLDDWDYWFVDTSSLGKAVHLRKMLEIFIAKETLTEQPFQLDRSFYSLDHLFDDCLWEFCSRLRISTRTLSIDSFKNKYAKEFYQHQTSVIRRFHCLKNIFQHANQLQQEIIGIYHEKISMNGATLQKSCRLIYQIAKDTLTGNNLTGLVDVLQSRIRSSFDSFVLGFLKYLVDDYGLDNLHKLSETATDYMNLLRLIDYSVLVKNTEDDSLQKLLRETMNFNDRFSCIPQTPLLHLLRQRLMILIDMIKGNIVAGQVGQRFDQDNDDRFNIRNYQAAYNYNGRIDDDSSNHQYELFRNQLIDAITNDPVFKDVIKPSIVQSFIYDSIQIQCQFIERNFDSAMNRPENTIDFLTKWLSLTDDQEKNSMDTASDRNLWLFANVCTLLQYELNDLLSLYSACRITDHLNNNQPVYNDLLTMDGISRSDIREKIFVQMFENLWDHLVHAVRNRRESNTIWVENYDLISRYYPSEQVLKRIALMDMKDRIEFMNLAYLILLNEQIPQPIFLIKNLLDELKLSENSFCHPKIVCLKEVPFIITTISNYCQASRIMESTLMIDIQAWIIRILKSSFQDSKDEIIELFRFLNQPDNVLSLPTKQLLFSQLCSIQMQNARKNQTSIQFWDHIDLLPIIIQCIDNFDVEQYQLPYHPSVIKNPQQNQILLDLYFFHLRELSNEELIRVELLHKIIMYNLSPKIDRKHFEAAQKVFKQIKDYFIIYLTASLLCQTEYNPTEQKLFENILKSVIQHYLQVDFQATELTAHLKLFFSIIIAKKDMSYLQNLLQSDQMKKLNSDWTKMMTELLSLSRVVEETRTLRLCHQIQFTIHTATQLSVFPKLHQPYHELNQCVHRCIENKDVAQRWKSLIDWIRSKLTTRPPHPFAVEIKVMLLLNIYYNYYCKNQLASLDGILSVIENHLQPNREEMIVFRAFLKPNQHMMGYNATANEPDYNYFNNFFHLDCKNHDALAMRHILVNLLAMILLAGERSFLWAFAFEPSKLPNTLGFGSVRGQTISTRVHYDCGCLLSDEGTVILGSNGRSRGSFLDIPAVYIAYFATFGAFAWHTILYENSVENLYNKILTPTAIDGTHIEAKKNRIVGGQRRTLSAFVFTRIGPTKYFLERKLNPDETCILLTRCFERLAALSCQPNDNKWIKPIFKEFDEQYSAEKGFQDHVFYKTNEQLSEHTRLISFLNAKSEIQKDLQEYVANSPMIIRYEHFQAELSNPNYSHLPLRILRHILDSFDYLQITKYIYALSRFYLLLHRTFSHMIEEDELASITLEELYERSRQHFLRVKQPSQTRRHWSIIQDGIEAVNGYHKFSGGQIRPGACEVTQGFPIIEMETAVINLVETEDSESGNIIKHILNILVEFHNHTLNMLEQEIDNNHYSDSNPLKAIIQASLKKEISIVQVAENQRGIMTIDEHERHWIEQLSRTCLQNQETYFLHRDTPLRFDYLYIQSYIIRTYLLYCRVEMEHIKGQYQCLKRRKQPARTTAHPIDKKIDIDPSLYEEWSHLRNIDLGRLEKEQEFLQRIKDNMTNTPDERLSMMSLSEFVQSLAEDGRLVDQYEEYQMKDFRLNQIDDIYNLYTKAIGTCQQMFDGISEELMESLSPQLEKQFNENIERFIKELNETDDNVKLDGHISMISDFIDELKVNSVEFAKRSSESYRETGDALCFESKCHELVPDETKCKNYVAICKKLIDLRSRLYEKKISIREKSAEKWSPFTTVLIDEDQSQESHFEQFLPTPDNILPDDPEPPSPSVNDQKAIGKCQINTIVIKPSDFYSRLIQGKVEERQQELQPRFVLKFPDNSKPNKSMVTQPSKIYEKFRETLKREKFDPEKWTIVDSDGIKVDFDDPETIPSIKPSKFEYTVIEKAKLALVHLDFQGIEIDYFVTREAQLSSIVSYYIVSLAMESSETVGPFHLFDQNGRLLDADFFINDFHPSNVTEPINFKLIPSDSSEKKPIEVVFTPTSGSSSSKSIREVFSPEITWADINNWLNTVPWKNGEASSSSFEFWSTANNDFTEQNQSVISDPLDSSSLIVEVICGEAMIDVLLSYNQLDVSFRLLKSTTLEEILQNPQCLKKFQWTISAEYCIFKFGQGEEEKLRGNDLKRHLEYYASKTKGILCFDILTFVRIFIYNEPSAKPAEKLLELPHRDDTIGDLLEMLGCEDGHHYLASSKTKIIYDNKLHLNELDEQEFYLIKDLETRLISIRADNTFLAQTNEINNEQRYMMNATVNDVRKYNFITDPTESVQDDPDFVPSVDTPLSVLIRDPSICLSLTKTSLQKFTPIIIKSREENNSIKLFCLSSLRLSRLTEIICRLWRMNSNSYRLESIDGEKYDENMRLLEIFESINNQQLMLTSKADIICSIEYQSETMKIATMKDTLISSIVTEALGMFRIFNEDISEWKVFLMDDPESPTEIDLELSIDFLIESFPENSSIILLKLMKD